MSSQLERIQKALIKNGKTGKGISATRLANLTKTPLDSVHKRIHDLRKAGAQIGSIFENVKGQRKVFYRVA
jgi:hypothetical protein